MRVLFLLLVSTGLCAAVLSPVSVLQQWNSAGGAVVDVPDHWWKFTESSGTTVEDYGDATDLDGTLDGSWGGSGGHTWKPTEDFNSTWTGGLEQVSDQGSGSGDGWRTEIGNPDFDGVSKLSLCMWIQKDSSGSNASDQRLFSQADDWGEDDHIVMFGFTSGETFRARLRNSSGDTTTYVSSASITENVDAHLCFVLDLTLSGDELVIYEDGSSVDTITVSGTQLYDDVDGTIYTAIGAQKAGGTAYGSIFNGLIADVRLWIGEARSAAEVADIYDNTY